MAAEDRPKEPQVLFPQETIYGEDHLIEDLKKRGRTERTSSLLASLIGRIRRHQVPGVRQTSTGNTLRLVKDEPIEGEVVNEDKKG